MMTEPEGWTTAEIVRTQKRLEGKLDGLSERMGDFSSTLTSKLQPILLLCERHDIELRSLKERMDSVSANAWKVAAIIGALASTVIQIILWLLERK